VDHCELNRCFDKVVPARRILFYAGAHALRNMGDVAMLQVALRRVRQAHPRAELTVLTTRPDLLARYCPQTTALPFQFGELGYQPEEPALPRWRERWRTVRRRVFAQPRQPREFREMLSSADLLLASGGGYLNDLNPTQTRAVFRMLDDAGARGKRTALFSLGLGPLQSPELLGLLRRVGRRDARVGLRERCRGPEILRRAGFSRDRFAVTGDDAVELAWERPPSQGTALGFGLRQVGYSGIHPAHQPRLRQTLDQLQQTLQTAIVPLPVSFYDYENDSKAIAEVAGTSPEPDGLDDPQVLIGNVSRCRVLVTGTYHPAVFALALGIPCVCFYASPYYRDKLEGLAGQFPHGCELVNLADPDAQRRMINLTLQLWKFPEESRTRLCHLAREQVEIGRRFYHEAIGGQS
jgi:polysaccharide pyruvyl transferase WcaK-like protein